MDTNQPSSNPNPVSLSTPQIPQTPPTLPQKKLPKILTIVFMVLLLGATGLLTFQNYQLRQQLADDQRAPVSPITNDPSPTSTPTVSQTWLTQQITLERETEFGGKTSQTFSLKFPSNWKLQTIPRGKTDNYVLTNCADYIISNHTTNVKLEITPICSGWSATYLSIPNNVEIVSKREKVGDDGHTSYLIRFFEQSSNQYIYGQVAGSPGKSLDINSDKMATDIMKVFETTPFVFKSTLSNPDKNESAIIIADEIMTYILSQ